MTCIREDQMIEMLDRGGLDATTAEERTHLDACDNCRESWATIAAAEEVLSEGRSRSATRGVRWIPLAAAGAMLLTVIGIVVLRNAPSVPVPQEKVTPEEAIRRFVDGDTKQSQSARELLAGGGRQHLGAMVKSRQTYQQSIRYSALQDLIYSLKKSGWSTQDPPAAQRTLETLKLDLGFEQTPLGDVLEFIHTFCKVNVVLDPGLEPKWRARQIDVKVKDSTLRDTLDLICFVGELDFDLRHGVVWISTPDRLWSPKGPATQTNHWTSQVLGPAEKELAGKLRSIRITLDMQNAPLTAIVDYVREISGISFVLDVETASELEISVKLGDASLAHLLEILTLPFGLDARIERDGIKIFRPKK